MTRRTAVLALVFGCMAHGNGSTAAPSSAVPVLVELFTAEGCSSCPAADRVFAQMLAMQPAKDAVIVGLGEHVDYWDRSGWKDRFSSAQFTSRQEAYVERLKAEGGVYTPQMIVDGQAAFVGSDVGAAREAIERAIGRPHGALALSVAAEAGGIAASVIVTELPELTAGDRAELLVAVTEDGLQTEVKRGENRGRTLTHAVVVRRIESAGDVAAGEQRKTTLKIDTARRDALRVVAFVQERHSRRILATAVAALR